MFNLEGLETGEELEAFYQTANAKVVNEATGKEDEENDKKLEEEATQIILRREGETREEYENRVDGFLFYIGYLENCDRINKEIERLKKLKTSRTNLAKRLKDLVMYRMRLNGKDKLETPRYRIKIAVKGGMQPVEVDYDVKQPKDLELIPKEYLNASTSYRVNRKALARDLMNGKELSWARLLEREEYLKIS